MGLPPAQLRDRRRALRAAVDDYPEEELPENEVTLLDVVDGVERFTYEYDYGDSWDHEIIVEDLWRVPLGLKSGVCIGGENACPPEDVGGPHGYAEFVQVLADPDHPEHDRMVEWSGGSFDPARFDLALANARLQAVRRRSARLGD